MNKILSLIFTFLLTATAVKAEMFIAEFEAIEKGDTLLMGFFKKSDNDRYNAIMSEWNEMAEKELQTQGLQRNKEMAKEYTPTAANAEMERLEQKRADALKELDKIAGMLPGNQVATMRKEINDTYDSMIANTPKAYADITGQMEAQNAVMTQYNSSEFSNEKKYELKRRFAALAVDGKLHGYTRSRDFRHGRAAVCRQRHNPENGMTSQLWGFVDESGREIVPCIYYKVCDFYNVTRASGFSVSREDADSQGWTTVWDNGMGMIDLDGNVKIPCKFKPTPDYQRIIFFQTPWGEFAQVCDASVNKYGIIDRNGNYTMQPTETRTITWYYDIECFGYRTDDGQLITFDPYGNRVTPQH